MKAAKITIRIMVMFLTAVWGLILGIAAPLFIMSSDLGIASHHVLRVWLVMAVVGYFAPCFLMMFDKSKIAAGFSIAGTVMALYIHSVFSEHAQSFTYLPQIFMTILTLLYIFIINPHYITEVNQKRLAKLNAPAPSIFEKSRGDYQPPVNQPVSSKKKKKKRKK
jgi:hypothetical protein